MKARQELPLRLKRRQVVVDVDEHGLLFRLKGTQYTARLSWQHAATAAFGTMVLHERDVAALLAKKEAAASEDASA